MFVYFPHELCMARSVKHSSYVPASGVGASVTFIFIIFISICLLFIGQGG